MAMAKQIRFSGQMWRLCDNWFEYIPVAPEKSINYLEIGCLHGANLLSVMETYAQYRESKAYAVDPWEDYEDYAEYQGLQTTNYDLFLNNIEPYKNKIEVVRDYSHNVLHKFDDEFFDIVYIDGNHEPEYVLEDAVLTFRKVKQQGYIVFDDYGWCDVSKGIDAFLSAYHKKVRVLGMKNTQMFLQKL